MMENVTGADFKSATADDNKSCSSKPMAAR